MDGGGGMGSGGGGYGGSVGFRIVAVGGNQVVAISGGCGRWWWLFDWLDGCRW